MSYDAKPIYHLDPAVFTPQITQGLQTIQNEWLPLHERDSSVILYHYTTSEGLKGILTNRSIWCSHISSFNDPTEFQYGKSLVMNEVNNALENQHEHEIELFLKNLIKDIESFEIIYNIYVACFCESDSLLSQWIGYGGSGGGYNIGIAFFDNDTKFCHDYEYIHDINQDSHVILRKIIYKEKEQTKLIKKVVQVLIESASKALAEFNKRDNLPDAWPNVASKQSVNILYDIALSLKNPAFEEEAEWRLIKTIDVERKPNLDKIREQNGKSISYLDTHIFTRENDHLRFPLRNIRFGPTLDEEITEPKLRLLVNNLASNASIIKINAADIGIKSAGFALRP